MMEKRLKFLRYILNEDITSIIRQVFEALRYDSRKGDFYDLVMKDLEDLKIDLSEEDIQVLNKSQWKKYVHEKAKDIAFEDLIKENEQKSKTRQILFDKLTMSEYLVRNKNTMISQIIFSVRSGTLDLKSWCEWNYSDKLCVMCSSVEESFDNFMSCQKYGNNLKTHWKLIFENDPDNQYEIATEVKRRHCIRKTKLDKAGLPPNMAPLLQTPVELL